MVDQTDTRPHGAEPADSRVRARRFAGLRGATLVEPAALVVSVAAVVIVQIVPPAPVEHLGERLISACTQGLRQGACVLSGESDAAQRSNLAAEVRWDDGYRVATVRVLRQSAAESEEMSGKIVFDDADALEDRWTTAGFTIATLVGDLTSWTDPSSAVPAPKEPAQPRRDAADPLPPKDERPSAGTRRRAKLRTAAGLAVGQGMHDHALRAGPWASLAFAPLELPAALLLRGAVAWASAKNLSVRWSTVALGMEARWPFEPSPAKIVVAADGGLSHIIASNQQTASRVSAALSLFAGGEIAVSDPIGVVAGVRMDAGPTTQLATPAELVVDRRVKFAGSVGVLVKL